ncbi:MAG TPA: mechanosensitive ion channel family protein [Methanomicrobiales archaeon]|nr:mechanosensitive ion channel family protein [Methanomicrobiales archaeon]
MSLGTRIIGTLTLWDLIVIALTIIVALVIAQLVSLNLKKVFSGKVHGRDLEVIIKIVYWAVVVAAGLIIFSQLRVDLSGLLIAGGFASIVIGIASQSVVGNLISGIFILVERPISIGDEVLIGNLGGYVEDIRILSTLVRTHDGVYTRVPNQEVFTSNITNYVAHPARRVEYTIGVGHGEDLARLRAAVLAVLDSSPYSLVRPEPEISLTSIADDRLLLSVYFWTPSRLYTPSRAAVLEGIQREFLARGIEIPPPRRHISLFPGDPGQGGPGGDGIRRVL